MSESKSISTEIKDLEDKISNLVNEFVEAHPGIRVEASVYNTEVRISDKVPSVYYAITKIHISA